MAALDPKLRTQLTRFLHVGIETPKYFPGCWDTRKYFELEKLTCIDAIVAGNQDRDAMLSIIAQAYKDGYYTRYETIAFALVKCLHIGDEKLKEATYKIIPQICQTPEELMQFTKFTKVFKTGHGHGWCKTIKSWYLGKDPMELVQEVTRVKGRYGRTHHTLIRKCHVKIPENDHIRDVVVKYTIYGLKKTKQLVGTKPEAQAALDYIQRVENVRHCEDPAAAASIIQLNKFGFDHVPGHLLTAQEVWDAVLPQMDLENLLKNLLRIHNMGFLTSDSATTAIVLSLLSNKEYLTRAKVSPMLVYITLCDYKRSAKPLKFVKQKIVNERVARRRSKQILDTATGQWKWLSSRRHPKEVKYYGIDQPPNAAIVTALHKVLDSSWPQVPLTGARYMITMDMRNHMFKGRHFCKTPDTANDATTNNATTTKPDASKKKAKKEKASNTPATPSTTVAAGGDAVPEGVFKVGKKRLLAECFFNKHVTPGHAAIVLALTLLKREKDVKIAVFREDGVLVVELGKYQHSIEKMEKRFREACVGFAMPRTSDSKAKLGRVKMDAPMEWAVKYKAQVDVFINIMDRTTRHMELEVNERERFPDQALQQYRAKMNMPKAKLITMSLASHKLATTDGSHEGILDIIGIDEHIPKVIDAFVMEQFD